MTDEQKKQVRDHAETLLAICAGAEWEAFMLGRDDKSVPNPDESPLYYLHQKYNIRLKHIDDAMLAARKGGASE